MTYNYRKHIRRNKRTNRKNRDNDFKDRRGRKITLYLDKEVLKALNNISIEEDRSLSYTINKILNEVIERRILDGKPELRNSKEKSI